MIQRYHRNILPFGQLCRAWRMRCGISASNLANMIGLKNSNDIYQFESGRRASLFILSGYIEAGCDITYELTRSMYKNDN